MRYIDTIDDRLKEYFNILEPNFPEWLNDYIDTPELLKQNYISVTCGTIYSDLFESKYFFSSLDHSVAVALIVWHFTHDKKETLSGLFHDIATPCFKHCIDFLKGDYENQEATEDLTTSILENSKEIMPLLKRDGIKLEEVDDYHKYPIADNDTPKLSADRLEYSLSNAVFTYNKGTIEDIKEIYNDIYVNNDLEETELAFKHTRIATKFVKITSKLSIIYRANRTRYSMQLIADILKKLESDGLITIDDLYEKKESDIIEIIKSSKYKNIFEFWAKATKINTSDTKPAGVYSINLKAKIRYINPLVNNKRVYDISKLSKRYIDNNLLFDMNKYVYLDIDF